MVESKKKPKTKRNRIPVNITLPPELIDYKNETRLNLSLFVEICLKSLQNYNGNKPILNAGDIELRFKKEADSEWIRRDSNPRTSPCEGDVIPLDHESA